MKRLIFIVVLIGFTLSNRILADGGALGLQLGGITFGLGGSSNGPIIGVGPSPDNDLPISFPIVPGSSCCCSERSCSSDCCSTEESYVSDESNEYYE